MSLGETDTVQVTNRDRSRGSANSEIAHDTFTLTAGEAIVRIKSGEVELAAPQEKPPFAIYEHAKLLLTNLDAIGPEFTSPKALERASEALWTDGKPAAMVNGREVRWFYQSIEPELCKVLTDGVGKGPNLFRQLDLVLSNHIQHARGRSYEVEQTEREQENKGLLPFDLNSPIPVGQPKQFVYRVIGPDWLRFKTAMGVLRGLRDQFLQTCLEQGRVLAVDDFVDRSGLIPPTRWQREAFAVGKHVNYHFVLSADLPRQWINDSKGPHDKAARQGKAKAIDWLEAEYANLGPDNKPKAKAEYVDEMRTRFGISKNAAKEAWSEAVIPDWKQSGRPKRS